MVEFKFYKFSRSGDEKKIINVCLNEKGITKDEREIGSAESKSLTGKRNVLSKARHNIEAVIINDNKVVQKFKQKIQPSN